ncbi:MAG TPA: PilZ domain-containing protein [Stellaceae bacterium]|nr:PilZ domain-containing protein [Stellaceae bacterium]
MSDQQITDAKELLERVNAFGVVAKDRRQFTRQSLQWAAKVEVRGERFEGTIVDFSEGGARIRFDAPVSTGDELTLVLKQLDDIGAKVVWQRQGEAGLKFLLAPDDVGKRIQSRFGTSLGALDLDQARSELAPAPQRAASSRPPAGEPRMSALASILALSRSPIFAAAIVVGTAFVGLGGSLAILSAKGHEAPILPPLSVTLGAADQHTCSGRMDKVNGSSNQIDFSLRVAEAVQAKCLDLHPGTEGSSLEGHVVSMTKNAKH